MTVRRMETLSCDGMCPNYSTAAPRFALLLDGWTTVDKNLDPNGPEENRYHLCSRCTLEVFLTNLLKLVTGERTFVWEIYSPETAAELAAWEDASTNLRCWRVR